MPRLEAKMIEQMDKTLGELIQDALAELGWSQAELARRTDFSPTHIGNLIRDYSPGTKTGKPTRLPVETVDRIADALKRPRSVFRKSAGLLPEEAHADTIEEALESSSFFERKGIEEKERAEIRPLLQSADRILELLKLRHTYPVMDITNWKGPDAEKEDG